MTFAPVYYAPFKYWSTNNNKFDVAEQYQSYYLNCQTYDTDDREGVSYNLSSKYLSRIGYSQMRERGSEDIHPELLADRNTQRLMYIPTTLGLVDSNIVTPTADMGQVRFFSYADSTGSLHGIEDNTPQINHRQAHNYLSTEQMPQGLYWSNLNDDNPVSFAQMVASYLGQIYTVTGNIKQYVYQDLLSAEEYDIIWYAPVIIAWNEITDSDVFIIGYDSTTNLGSTFTEYRASIQSKMPELTAHNVTLTSLRSSQTIDVKYQTSYDADILLDEYNTLSQTNQRLRDFCDGSVLKRVSSEVNPGTLYTYDGELSPLPNSDLFSVLTKFREVQVDSNNYLCADKTDMVLEHKIPVDAVGMNGQLLTINQQELPGINRQYRIKFDNKQAGKHYFYLNNLPRINLFNYTSVCPI